MLGMMATIHTEMMPEMLPRIAARFRALADETRLRLLIALQAGEQNVTTLTRDLGIAQASVSKHLATLRQAGLIDVRHEGNQSFYFVHDESVFSMCEVVCGGIIRQVEQDYRALALASHDSPRKNHKRGKQ
jgi:DNA-binding transcriptional ArsR family regulator